MLTSDKKICVAMAAGREICLTPGMGNRHGLVTGATGTGKPSPSRPRRKISACWARLFL